MKRNFSRIPILSDWTPFAPNSVWATPSSGFWRRVGDTMEINASLNPNGAMAGNATVDIPMSLNIDTAKVNGINQREIYGTATIFDSSTSAQIACLVQGVDANTVAAYYIQAGGSDSQSVSIVTGSAPITIASGDTVRMNFKVPIQGWGSNRRGR